MVNDCMVIQCCRHYEFAPDPYSKIKNNGPLISGQNYIKIVARYPSLKCFVPKWVNIFIIFPSGLVKEYKLVHEADSEITTLPNVAESPSNDIYAMKVGLKLTNSKQTPLILVCTASRAPLTTSRRMLVTLKLANIIIIIIITTTTNKLEDDLAKASGPIAL